MRAMIIFLVIFAAWILPVFYFQEKSETARENAEATAAELTRQNESLKAALDRATERAANAEKSTLIHSKKMAEALGRNEKAVENLAEIRKSDDESCDWLNTPIPAGMRDIFAGIGARSHCDRDEATSGFVDPLPENSTARD